MTIFLPAIAAFTLFVGAIKVESATLNKSHRKNNLLQMMRETHLSLREKIIYFPTSSIHTHLGYSPTDTSALQGDTLHSPAIFPDMMQRRRLPVSRSRANDRASCSLPCYPGSFLYSIPLY